MSALRVRLVAALLLLLGLAPIQATVAAPPPVAHVRIVHASPDAPAVDVYVDSLKIVAGATFFSVSDYVDVPATGPTVKVFAAGADPNTATPVTSLTPILSAGGYYTIAAYGKVGNGSLVLKSLVDDVSAPGAGQAKLSAYHFAIGAPAVDIRSGATTLVNDLAFGNSSALVTAPAGSIDLTVTDSTGLVTVATVPNVELKENRIYEVFAIGEFPATVAFKTKVLDPGARVRVVHASPDAPAVDVYVDGSKVLSGAAFFSASDYLHVAAGAHTIKVFAAGADPNSATPVIDTSVVLDATSAYSIIAAGPLASLTPIVTKESVSAPFGGQARLRVYHLSSDAPAVDVRVAGATTPLIDNLAFGSSADVSVPPGVYNLEVTTSDGATVLKRFPAVEAQSGRTYNVFAVGQLASIAFRTEVLENAARLRIVHASPDAPAVDVYLNGSKAYTGISFFSRTALLAVEAGVTSVAIVPTGQPLSAAVYNASLTFEEGETYTVVARGLLAAPAPAALGPSFGVSVFQETAAASAGKARLNIYHLSPDAPAVDVRLADGTLLAGNLSYGDRATLEVPAGTYDVRVTTVGGATEIKAIGPVTLFAGEQLDVYAAGTLQQISFKPFASIASDQLQYTVSLPLIDQNP